MAPQQWTHDQFRGAIWTLNYLIDLARLSDQKADAITGLILPKLVANSGLGLHPFREIVSAMDADEGLLTRIERRAVSFAGLTLWALHR